MPRTVTLRNVPDSVVRALRARARRNRRSMQKETLAVLESAVVDRGSLIAQLAGLRARTGARMTLNEIHAAIRDGRP